MYYQQVKCKGKKIKTTKKGEIQEEKGKRTTICLTPTLSFTGGRKKKKEKTHGRKGRKRGERKEKKKTVTGLQSNRRFSFLPRRSVSGP